MRSVKPLLAGAAALLALLAAPTVAPAATTCDLGGGLLEVQMSAAGDEVDLSVADGGGIEVVSGAGPVTCTGGPPTVSNTNVISMFNGPNGADNEVSIFGPSRFAPGANTAGENGGTPEIEISVNLNDRPNSLLTVGDSSFGVPIHFGASGINTNAVVGEVQPDADIFYAGVPEFVGLADGVSGSVITAQGGQGAGGELTAPITLFGGAGADVLIGGEGADEIDGYDGSDTVLGEGGNDVVETYVVTGESDFIDGGAGTDEAVVQGLSGVTVDLAIAGPQSPGSGGTVSLAAIENLIGTEFNDVLSGNGEANTLRGDLGDDLLDGRGGIDLLEGGPGADSLIARDAGADSADCGAEIDTVTADAAGVDTLTACENALFPEVGGPGPPGGGPDAPDVPGGTAGRCGGKRATITATNAGETIRGTRRRDVIDARGGNDRVKALGGNDIVCGGRGRDRLDGGRGADNLSGGIGNDKLSGGPGRDKLSGGSGTDRLLGGSGRDVCLGESRRARVACERRGSAGR